MNGRKARAIRNLCKSKNAWAKEAKYKKIENKKILWLNNDKGELKPKELKTGTFTLVNLSKYTYRRMKKVYQQGKYKVPVGFY